jgi:type IV secretory pathway VirB4 component
LTARDGSLVGFHPFNPEFTAWNATIAGATGSGKSFVTRCLLNGWVGTGGRVVVVTIGSDYHRFVQIFGGTAHDITLDDPQLALGPFPTAKNLRQSKAPNEILGHLSNVIAIMLCEKGKHLGRLHRHLIFKTTQSLYDDTSCDHPTFVDWLDRLQHIETHGPDDKTLIKEITAQLLFWVDGPYGHAFLRNRSMDPNEKLSVWNLKNIRDDDTRGVVLALLSGIIAQSIETSPTIIVMDEVWSILKGEAGPDLVESLYRTVRKEGSSIWSISQSMSDYAALPAGCRDAILNNSPFKMLLAHEAANIETAASICQASRRATG